MAKSGTQRVFTIVAVPLAGLLVLAAIALVASGIPRTAAGMAAKGICSAAFVANRPRQDLLAQEVLPASPVLRAIDVSIDESAKAVKARFAGLFERQARLLPNRGCVLDAEPPLVAEAPAGPSIRAVTDPGRPWPQGDAALAPAEWGEGVDRQALEQLAQDAFNGAGDPQAANTRAIAILYKGRAMVLRSAPGFVLSTPLHGWSMAKSVLGMLSYKLAHETGLSWDTPVVDAFTKGQEPVWASAWRGDARKNIKMSDLLYMRDGLASTEGYDPWGDVPRMLWGAADTASFAAEAAPEAPPGQRWRYLSASANLLAAVDRSRMANDADYWAYPSKALFRAIGAHSAVMETDTAGNWVGSSYLWASVGDWARLGQLLLQDGNWGGQQVLPPGWLKLASAHATAQGPGRGYGAMGWLIGEPETGECQGYGIPPDAVAMIGHWGQMVAVVPSRDAVVVRLGWTFKRKQFDNCAFVAAALKALPHL